MDLKDNLEDMYKYYFKQRRSLDDEKEHYAVGKCDGAVDAIGAIYLSIYGGEALYRLWQTTLQETERK